MSTQQGPESVRHYNQLCLITDFEDTLTNIKTTTITIKNLVYKLTKQIGVRFVMVNVKFAFWFSNILSQYRCGNCIMVSALNAVGMEM